MRLADWATVAADLVMPRLRRADRMSAVVGTAAAVAVAVDMAEAATAARGAAATITEG